MVASPIRKLPCHPPGLIPFPFVFSIDRLDSLLSFFRFFFWKNDSEAKLSKAQTGSKRNEVKKCKTKKTIMNIIGRLTRDAEVRTLSNEKQVVNFSVATNDSYKNKQGNRIEQTTYFDCSYWLSTKVAALLTQGTLVELTGRVSARAWVDRGGEPKAGLNFHTSQIKLHGGSKKTGTVQATMKAENNKTTEDDLPF